MVETHGLGPYRIGRRRALGLAVLGSLGATIGSGVLAGDAGSRARRLKVVARPAVPVPHHQAPAPVPTVLFMRSTVGYRTEISIGFRSASVGHSESTSLTQD